VAVGVYPKSDFSTYLIGPASRAEAEPLVRAHYLKRWPGVVVATLGMWKGPFLVGVIVFALPPRETAKRYRVRVAWELARLFVLDSEPFNSETWLMGKAVKWVKSTFPTVDMLVSYADPSAGHTGVIYRAANWVQDGRTDQERKTPRFDYGVGMKIYSRRSHVPEGAEIVRIPRISKFRFTYRLRKDKPQNTSIVVRRELK
jgi:hypothetical protein